MAKSLLTRTWLYLLGESSPSSPPEQSAASGSVPSPRRRWRERGVVELHPEQPRPEVQIRYPRSYEDTEQLADLFKAGYLVIVDLEHTEESVRQSIIDFLSGVAYGLDGHAYRVNPLVFAFAPRHFEVATEEDLSREVRRYHYRRSTSEASSAE